MIPFIQRMERVQRGQRAARRLSASRRALAQHLDRHRRDVVVGASTVRAARPASTRHAGDRARSARRWRRTARAEAQSTPERAQLLHPRIDPHVAGRAVEHAVGLAAGRDRSCSSCSRIEPPVRALISRARAATSERVRPSARNLLEPGERRSASANSHQLSFSYWPKRRSSQADSSAEQPDEVHLVLGRDAQVRADGEPEAQRRPPSRRASREVRGGDELVARRPRARSRSAVDGDEVVEDPVAGPRVGDAPHRVGQVPVEAGEEAEAVLAGQRAAPAGARRAAVLRALPPGRARCS